MIISIHHIQLAMPKGEEKKARNFYSKVLGLKEVPKPLELLKRGGVWFELGGVRVHLGVDPSFVSATKAHPAFLVEDLDEYIIRCKQEDVEVIKDKELEGYKRIYINDPFGNRIELLQEVDS